MPNDGTRESFASGAGFLLSALGAAVGVGNIWRFPYMAGSNGGGAFLIPYLAAVLILAVPAVMLELSYGRHFRGGPVIAHQRSGLPHGRALGYIVIALSVVGFSYYLVLTSWTLKYCISALSGSLWSTDPHALFSEYMHVGWQRYVYHLATVLLCAGVVHFGIRNGIEPVMKYMVAILFVLLLALAAYSLTLPGAARGLSFLFSPDLSKITSRVWLMALGQVLFSVGIGGTVLVTYGSYMQDSFDIPRMAVGIVLGDTLAAILAGVAIFPAVFTMGAQPTEGVGLVFYTLPAVFAAMPGGHIFGPLFFIGLFFAAASTGLFAVEFLCEPLIYAEKWDRRNAVIFVAVLLWAVGLLWCNNLKWLSVFDLVNAVLSLPLTAILVPIGFLWIYGAGKALEEVNKNSQWTVGKYWPIWAKYGLPLVIFMIYARGVWEFATR